MWQAMNGTRVKIVDFVMVLALFDGLNLIQS